MNDRLLRLASGQLLLPVLDQQRGCLVWLSDDDGLTWRMGAGAVRPNAGETCREPSLVELPNGRVAMFIRTANRANQIYIATSDDGDAGWQIENEWGPVSFDASCVARRLPESEEILLLWNNHCLANNLTSAISHGRLRFWEHLQVLEQQDRWPDPKTYSYPSVTFFRGQAHITYLESESGGARYLIYRRFPTTWFRTDSPGRAIAYDARAYVKRMWEEAPVHDPNKYMREYATASFNPADAKSTT